MDFEAFTKTEVGIIKQTCFPEGTTEEDKTSCLLIANSLNLNPLMKEITFIERKVCIEKNGKETWLTKTEPMVGRDGYLTIAHRTGVYGGMETTSDVVEVPYFEKETGWSKKTDLVAKCSVYRKDSQVPTIVEVIYSEYAMKKKDGSPTRFWRDKPITMLKKVAESQALRKAFNISGVYSLEEMGMEEDDDPKTPPVLPSNSSAEDNLEKEIRSLERLGIPVKIDGAYAIVTAEKVPEKHLKLVEGLGYSITKGKSGAYRHAKKIA